MTKKKNIKNTLFISFKFSPLYFLYKNHDQIIKTFKNEKTTAFVLFGRSMLDLLLIINIMTHQTKQSNTNNQHTNLTCDAIPNPTDILTVAN